MFTLEARDPSCVSSSTVFYYLRSSLSLNLEVIHLIRLDSQPMSSRDLPVFSRGMLGLQTCGAEPGFHVGVGDTQRNLHSYVAGALLAEPSP